MLLDGTLSLKLITQICCVLDFFISFSFVMIFIILDTDIWKYLTFLYTLQTLSPLLIALDFAPNLSISNDLIFGIKMGLTAAGSIALFLFYML